jgi:hypothetical protein
MDKFADIRGSGDAIIIIPKQDDDEFLRFYLEYMK